jgi:hypothetical protein
MTVRRTRVKICGIRCAEDARAAAASRAATRRRRSALAVFDDRVPARSTVTTGSCESASHKASSAAASTGAEARPCPSVT